MDNENNQTTPPLQNQASASMPPPTTTVSSTAAPKKEREMGAIVGIIIIVIVLVLGGFYVWGARLDKMSNTDAQVGPGGETPEEISRKGDPATDNLNTQGTSDELNAIEDDLDTTSLNGLDAEVKNISVELQ